MVGRPLRQVIGVALCLLAWQGCSSSGLVDGRFVPSPSLVLRRLLDLLGQEAFLRDIVATVLAWAISLALAVAPPALRPSFGPLFVVEVFYLLAAPAVTLSANHVTFGSALALSDLLNYLARH